MRFGFSMILLWMPFLLKDCLVTERNCEWFQLAKSSAYIPKMLSTTTLIVWMYQFFWTHTISVLFIIFACCGAKSGEILYLACVLLCLFTALTLCAQKVKLINSNFKKSTVETKKGIAIYNKRNDMTYTKPFFMDI